jgi:hypothetical protein
VARPALGRHRHGGGAPGALADIVAGLAEAVAGAISMGGGSYLAGQAEEQLDSTEIAAAEGREIDELRSGTRCSVSAGDGFRDRTPRHGPRRLNGSCRVA